MGVAMKNASFSNKKPCELRNMSVGISKDGFLLTFNTDCDLQDYSIMISAEQFSKVISLLAYAGKQFEEHYKTDIISGGKINED